MEQKVIITKSDRDINDYLANGWQVVSVTAQRVATGVNYSHPSVVGEFCFVIQRNS